MRFASLGSTPAFDPSRSLFASIMAGALVAFFGVTGSGSAQAGTIAESTGGTNILTTIPGQSVTILSGGAYRNIAFNFFDASQNSAAAGTLFILTQSYAGTPSALSNATAGYVAQSQSISGGVYLFDPTVILLGQAQYFVYATQSLTASGYNSNVYAGGNSYTSGGANTAFANRPGLDANFRLSGDSTTAPEPGSLTLLLPVMGVAGMVIRKRRKK